MAGLGSGSRSCHNLTSTYPLRVARYPFPVTEVISGQWPT
jgi:hypothetical protein